MCVCIHVCICVCACVGDRVKGAKTEREREREKEGDRVFITHAHTPVHVLREFLHICHYSPHTGMALNM